LTYWSAQGPSIIWFEGSRRRFSFGCHSNGATFALANTEGDYGEVALMLLAKSAIRDSLKSTQSLKMGAESCLYKEEIASGIGVFELQISATNEQLRQEDSAASQSVGHTITIKKVAAPTGWLPVGMRVDAAKAWLIYITKHTEVVERLSIKFTLPFMPSTIQSGADTGEWLTAIEFENGSRQVHIGTQDEEWFSRYGEAAWMLKRLVSALDKGLVVTKIEANGLITAVPELLMHEQFYLHYVLAESARHKSADYPDEWDVATWYAVDQSQKSLEAAWHEQAGHSSKNS